MYCSVILVKQELNYDDEIYYIRWNGSRRWWGQTSSVAEVAMMIRNRLQRAAELQQKSGTMRESETA